LDEGSWRNIVNLKRPSSDVRSRPRPHRAVDGDDRVEIAERVDADD
jgi:hypothetical protein